MKTRKEISRYVSAAPLVGLTDFGSYYLLILFLPYFIAKAISYLLANVSGYLFNKYWIFQKRKQSTTEAGRYLIVNVGLFICNVLINQAMLYLWPKAIFLALATAALVTALLSFISKKIWVFKTKSGK